MPINNGGGMAKHKKIFLGKNMPFFRMVLVVRGFFIAELVG
jgi:hypothetical protein